MQRDRYIGICYGPAGVGKTLSARRYAHWDHFEKFREVEPFKRLGKPPAFLGKADTVFYTADVLNSAVRMVDQIKRLKIDLHELAYGVQLAKQADISTLQENIYRRQWLDTYVKSHDEHCKLLIVDEADRLKISTFEQLRDFYDRGSCGLVLIGMPGIEKKLSRYPQFYSRIGFSHEFRPLSPQELLFIIERHFKKLGLDISPDDFTDHEAVTAIVHTTRGNFRLFHRLFTQIKRVMQVNDAKTVTREIVQAARDCLVIGV